MNELLELNKGFLIKEYLWISGILTCGFSIYLFFFFSEVSIKWILIVYSITLFFAPLLVLFGWISNAMNIRKHRKRILNKKPYTELEKIGFNKKAIKPNYNGLSDYILFGEINGYQITFDINISNPKIAEFIIYKPSGIIDKIDFSKYTFSKKIDTSKEKLNSIQELETTLTEMTRLVKNG